MARKSFGEVFKAARIASGQTLREFCLKHGFDPGNTSKLERDRLPPPQSRAKLTEYAKALGLRRGQDAWLEFFDIAATHRGRIPSDILSDKELVEKLPVLFRTLSGKKLTSRQLDDLVELIRRT